MKNLIKIILLGVILFITSVSYSQGVTKSAMNGQITDANGAPLPGANVVVIHLPTGSKYGSASDFDGFFRIPNMRPGGPYSLVISYVGYEDFKNESIILTLGQTKTINRALKETASTLEEVVITATKNNVFDSNRTGAKTTVTERDITTIPAASRSIADFVRATPQAQITEGNDGFSISLGGQNNRYNSIYVDGAVSNDVFGLAGSGTDGGQTGANPFSIDAIEQLQVQLAPFDVKISGFTGGAVNAISRSGSNEVKASAYSYLRNESLAGKTPTALIEEDDTREKLDDFTALTYGVRVGGPIVKDKLFYFVNLERQDNERPQPFNISNYGGNLGLIPNPGAGDPFIYNAAAAEAGLASFSQFMINTYGYDPGIYNNNTQTLKNNMLTAKLDWNINRNNDFSLTYRLQSSDNLEARNSSNGRVQFINGSEEFINTTNALNMQLNTSIGSKYANSLSFGYKSVRDDRDPSGNPFPSLSIQDGDSNITLGSEPFSTANLLNQDVVTITNNFEIFSGKHNYTIGLHNEYSKIKNLFFAYNYGFYSFENQFDDNTGALIATGLDQFIANQPADFYQHGYSLLGDGTVGDDSGGASEFEVYQLGLYVQDEITFSNRFKLSVGVRFDIPYWTGSPVNDDFNDRTIALLEAEGKDLQGAQVGTPVKTIVHPAPRVGFNWDVKGDNKTQIRGGLGLFTSRLPLVWPGGTYNNNGVTGGYSRQFGNELFNPDVNSQYASVAPGSGGVGGNIDLFAPDFKLPQVLKGNIAYDQKLPFWGLISSIDFIYNKNTNAIYYENLNVKGPAGFLNGADDRPYYDSRDEIDDTYGRIILASNTSEGNSWNGAVTIRKPFENGFSGQVSYSYGDANAIFDGTSSQNSSQWRGIQTVNGKNSDLPLSRSDFAQGHRISSNFSYELKWSEKAKTTIGFFYNGAQSRPFSYTYREGTDLLGDDSRDNALMYVPASASEITLVDSNGDNSTDDEWNTLNTYIENDKYLKTRRGQYAERNGSMGPWSHILDLKFLQDISFNTSKKKQTLQASLDIFNFTNLINKDWGRQRFASGNTSILQTQIAGPDPVFSLNDRVIEDGTELFDDSGIQSSRWQMQVGLRYSFN